MTVEKNIQLLKRGGLDAVYYQLGRECAMEDTANGEPSLAKLCTHLVDVMGEAWARGYNDYYNAWVVLNMA